MNSNTPPLVSIVCITYNQASFIREAIDSFFMQKTNFDFEILIHDDASIDNTADIIREYAAKDDRIVTIFQTENIFSKGINPGVEYLFPIARGKYLAVCEGDDYWTDPYKLQKQVDFLEANPEYSAAVHQTKKIYENHAEKTELYFQFKKHILTKKEIIYAICIHTNSIVFRKDALIKYELKGTKHLVEHGLFILIVQTGNFWVFPEVMSIYRKHDHGMAGISTPEKAYPGQIAWITEVSKILGMRFFWGYHFLSSKVHCHYSLYHPEVFVGGIFYKTYYFIKYTMLTLILYPRSMKTIFRLLPQFFKIPGKE